MGWDSRNLNARVCLMHLEVPEVQTKELMSLIRNNIEWDTVQAPADHHLVVQLSTWYEPTVSWDEGE